MSLFIYSTTIEMSHQYILVLKNAYLVARKKCSLEWMSKYWFNGSTRLNFQNACNNTHILSIQKRSIELLPYQDVLIHRLSCNVLLGRPSVQLHVSNKVRRVPIQCRYVGKMFPSLGPSINVDSMWRLLHPKLTKDTFRMMILYYPKIDQWHNDPPYMSAGSAIWGQRV